MNLSKLPGVESCEVSYKQSKATLIFETGTEPDVDEIKAAVTELGYSPGAATVRTNTN